MAFLGILCIIFSVALVLLFPLLSLPKPDGKYSVGITRFALKDQNRLEKWSKEPGSHREIVVQVWYPAQKPDQAIKPAEYWDKAALISSLQAQSFGVPPFLFQYLSLVKTNSYWNIPIAQEKEKYPVILFSPGFGSLFNENSIQMEHLASHGYIVCSIAHTYETLVALFPDGKSIPYSKEVQESFIRHAQKTTSLWQEWIASRDSSRKEAIVRQILTEDSFLDDNLRIRVKDIHLLLEELQKTQSQDKYPFSQKLDMAKTGIFGHSLGGATAVQAALENKSYKAVVNLDGLQAGDMIQGKTLESPLMIMYSALFSGVNDFMLPSVKAPYTLISIKGSSHINYTDNPFLFPITRMLGSSGKINPARMNYIISQSLLAFFNMHLQGEKTTIPMFPEAKIQSFLKN